MSWALKIMYQLYMSYFDYYKTGKQVINKL